VGTIYAMKITKRRIVIASSIVSLLLLSPYLLLYGSVSYGAVREHLHRIPFDSAKWQNSELVDGNDPIRIRMVDDLMKSRRLDGRSVEEVRKLLGKRTDTDSFEEYELVYWLGPERGFMGIDSEWLVISFDDKGVVQSYGIKHD
jgi:hypothetical protein